MACLVQAVALSCTVNYLSKSLCTLCYFKNIIHKPFSGQKKRFGNQYDCINYRIRLGTSVDNGLIITRIFQRLHTFSARTFVIISLWRYNDGTKSREEWGIFICDYQKPFYQLSIKRVLLENLHHNKKLHRFCGGAFVRLGYTTI